VEVDEDVFAYVATAMINRLGCGEKCL